MLIALLWSLFAATTLFIFGFAYISYATLSSPEIYIAFLLLSAMWTSSFLMFALPAIFFTWVRACRKAHARKVRADDAVANALKLYAETK